MPQHSTAQVRSASVPGRTLGRSDARLVAGGEQVEHRAPQQGERPGALGEAGLRPAYRRRLGLGQHVEPVLDGLPRVARPRAVGLDQRARVRLQPQAPAVDRCSGADNHSHSAAGHGIEPSPSCPGSRELVLAGPGRAARGPGRPWTRTGRAGPAGCSRWPAPAAATTGRRGRARARTRTTFSSSSSRRADRSYGVAMSASLTETVVSVEVTDMGVEIRRGGPARRPGLDGLAARRGVRREFGWDTSFEALVAGIVGDFARRPRRPAPGRLDRRARRPPGRLRHVRPPPEDPRVAQLRILLVTPDARGHGAGTALVDECVAFARAAGYDGA